MKPFLHAKISAKKYGGVMEDYLPIHDFIDSSKSSYANPQHRAILHSTFGIFLTEKVFGVIITNSDGKEVSTRDLAEEHVYQDLGFIPTIKDWLKDLPIEDWMLGRAAMKKRNKAQSFNSIEELSKALEEFKID